ncbi:MAG: OmpA family protein, partial [Bacteroidales bacterium]|nr:OmpA family protein [Bacteroidales bacterium]
KTNSAELESSSIAELNTLVELLTKNANISIEISGHTDNVGSATYNLELSTKRAQSVKAYLESKQIASYRLSAVGYGQTKPIADNNTEEGRAANRRTEFKIIKK